MSRWSLRQTARAIAEGAVFAYPTDTVWGFGCDPLNSASVDRICAIKRRSLEKGLILLAASLDDLDGFIDTTLDPNALTQLATRVEHPVTWLVPASSACPAWLRGDSFEIAVRITDHPFMRSIGEILHSPLVSTSANRSGQPTLNSALRIRKHFHCELDFIVGGYRTGKASASEIKSLTTGKIIRPYVKK